MIRRIFRPLKMKRNAIRVHTKLPVELFHLYKVVMNIGLFKSCCCVWDMPYCDVITVNFVIGLQIKISNKTLSVKTIAAPFIVWCFVSELAFFVIISYVAQNHFQWWISFSWFYYTHRENEWERHMLKQ